MQIDPNNENLARQMIRDGATRGMVFAALRKRGMTDEEIDLLHKTITSSETNRVRGKGAYSTIAGVVMIVMGCVALASIASGDNTVGRSPLLLIGFGAMLALKGLVTMVSGIAESQG